MTLSASTKTRLRRPHGAASFSGSAESKRLAAAILEVLAGVRTPTDAARALGTSVPRYYQLEQRALEGLLGACERRPQGRRLNETQQIGRLEREVARLEKECHRHQALARAAQRTIGLSASQPATTKTSGGGGKRGRRRRPTVRALRAAVALRMDSAATDSSSAAAVGGVQPEPSSGGAGRKAGSSGL
jgi:hypothetical protein